MLKLPAIFLPRRFDVRPYIFHWQQELGETLEYNVGMDDATTLAAAPTFDSLRTRLIQALVLTYQAAAALTLAAILFVADTWLGGIYLIGIFYLGVGLWVFRLRRSEPARELATGD